MAAPVVLFAGGKTGGHLFPGIAVAEILSKEGVSCVFIGSKGGIEEKILPEKGYELCIIKVKGLKGKSFFETLKNLFFLPIGFFQSLGIIWKRKPRLLVSLGGFAAGPAALAAKILRVPVVIMEQNSFPGITNRLVAKFADKAYLSFPDTGKVFAGIPSVITGNPVRAEIGSASALRSASGKPVLAVSGGSQGASSLNRMMVKMAQTYPELISLFHIFHQTGDRDREWVEKAYAAQGYDHTVVAFTDAIGSWYKGADVVICRAGASTVAELVYLGKPSIFIPFPYASDNHQFYNALYVTKQGAALSVEDRGDTEAAVSELRDAVIRMMKEKDLFTQQMAGMRSKDAARMIADEIKLMIGG